MPSDAEQPDLGDIRFAGKVPVPDQDMATVEPPVPGHDEASEAVEEQKARSSRGRRGGRRRRGDDHAPLEQTEQSQSVPPYVGPTPADPFAHGPIDIFDALEFAEAQRLAEPFSLTVPVPNTPTPDGVALASESVSPPPEVERSEPIAAPPIQPVIVGADEAQAVEKKRGWWRR